MTKRQFSMHQEWDCVVFTRRAFIHVAFWYDILSQFMIKHAGKIFTYMFTVKESLSHHQILWNK